MSQPPAYTPETAFVTYQAQQAWFPGQNLDVEFADLATTITAIRTNLALLQKDDGTLGNGLVGWDQLAPALQVALRAQGFTGAPSSGPNTWAGLQTFTTGISSVRYAMGANLSPSSWVDIQPSVGLSGYNTSNPQIPAFVFNDLGTAGWSFSDLTTHVACAIYGNKSVTAGTPNGTGGYTALQVTQNGQGASNSGYVLGALMQAVATYNPLGQNGGLYFGANPQVVVPPASGGVMSIQFAVGMEIDLLLQQNVVAKQALRIYDYYAGVGTTTQNASAIRVLKAPAGGGWSSGLVFASDYIAGSYLDSGFPVIAGGTLISAQTTSLVLGSGLNLSGALGGFSVGAIVLPAGGIANNGIIWGPAGLGGYILSATASGGSGIILNNGFTYFQFGGANTCWFTTGTTDGRLGLIGTGGGFTTLATANASGSSFTLTLPAITDTIVTLTATQVLSNKSISGTLTVSGNIDISGSFALTCNTVTVLARNTGTGAVTLSSGASTITFSPASTSVLVLSSTGIAASQTITATVGGNVSSFDGRSGGAATAATMTVGRTGVDIQFGAAGGSDQFFTGTVQGDEVFKALSGHLFVGTAAASGVVKFYSNNTLATTIDASQNLTQVGFLKGSTVYASGDAGGAASTNALSNVSSTTISSGTGTVKMSSTNSANNAVWIKLYAGTTAYWVPGWTTNAP